MLFYWVTDANILINKMFVTYLNVFILNFCFRISCSSQGHSEASSMWGSPKLILNVKQNHSVERLDKQMQLWKMFSWVTEKLPWKDLVLSSIPDPIFSFQMLCHFFSDHVCTTKCKRRRQRVQELYPVMHVRLHLVLHETKQILPNFQDGSVLPEMASNHWDVCQLIPLSIRARNWSLRVTCLAASLQPRDQDSLWE